MCIWQQASHFILHQFSIFGMCNRYTPHALLDIEREWALGRENSVRWWDDVLFPRGTPQEHVEPSRN